VGAKPHSEMGVVPMPQAPLVRGSVTFVSCHPQSHPAVFRRNPRHLAGGCGQTSLEGSG
jgi:hypothetical protein